MTPSFLDSRTQRAPNGIGRLVPRVEMPATPERVWRAIQAARARR